MKLFFNSKIKKLSIELIQPPMLQCIFNEDHEELASLLEKHPNDAKYLDSDKKSLLHAAAFTGDVEAVKILYNVGKLDVNAKDNNWLTPLHRACRAKQDDVVSLLLELGADEKVRDKNWQTPAHVAAANNAVKCFKLLEPKMSNINITDRMGRS